MSEEIRIRAEPLQLDPQSCRFTVSRVVHDGAAFFADAAAAVGSALPEALFDIPGVAHVHVAGDLITVGRAEDADWSTLMKPIAVVIRAQLQSPFPAVREAPASSGGRPVGDAEIRVAVQRVLDEGINPFVKGHGGQISIVDVRDAVVTIHMGGGCQGCSSASVTLRRGVEATIAEEVPEVRGVMDVTDHAQGKNPYYA
jgi:Fe-S cluster biogenesis protein NfuA